MEEIILLNELYDYYGELLTEKQRFYFEKYYFENLTMQEIAEIESVSKNAVSKQLDTIVKKLKDYEDKLKLKNKKENIRKVINKLDQEVQEEIEKHL
jgi:predicted DNA-binding protein YlxM (UPF0122 family)